LVVRGNAGRMTVGHPGRVNREPSTLLIRGIRLEHLLSFGLESPALSLRPLNVLIGPNGSGKSNLIGAISLLQAAPTELARPLRTDGVREWLWKGAEIPVATIDAIVENPRGTMPITGSRGG
jgi:chromosome segregation ATPase